MSPKVPKAYLDARRNEIIEAACRCVAEKGFHKTTMQDIYEATNLSPGAVYNYFHSKKEIVTAAAEQGQRQTTDAIKSFATESNNALGNVVHMFLSTIKDDDTLRSASANLELFAEAGRNHQIAEPVGKNMDAILTQIMEMVKHKQKDGVFSNLLDPLAVARVLIALYYGLVIQRVLDLSMDVDAYISVCDAIIEGSFYGEGRKENTQ